MPGNLTCPQFDLCLRRASKQYNFTICLPCNLYLPPVTLCDQTDWGVSNLQRHVHDGCHPPGCSSPGGGPETLPGGAAWFVHMNMAIYNPRHHHTVPHIQHLPSPRTVKHVSVKWVLNQRPNRQISFIVSLHIHVYSTRGESAKSESQLTSHVTSPDTSESIWWIFPSFIMMTAGRTSLSTSTLVLLTAATVAPSSMPVFIESNWEQQALLTLLLHFR